MKKLVSFLCVVGLLLAMVSLVSCDLLPDKRSEAAKNADALIEAIGEVVLENEEAIKAAQKAVAALSEEERGTLRNEETLTAAVEKLDSLKNKAQAAEIDALIETIGETITVDSGAAISEARAAYFSANDKVKELVTKEQKLIDAEKAYEDMLVTAVVEKIKAIGTVTLNSEQAINDARTLYNSLSSENKNKISNYSVLTAAEKKLAELKVAEREKKFKSLVSGMKVEKDEVMGNTFYYPSVWPRWADDRCYVLPYIGRRGDQVWLCAKYHYTDDDWVFFEKIIFSLDDGNITRSFNYFDLVHDNGGGDVWEYYNKVANDLDISIFRKIAVSNKRIVRFKGDDYSHDFTISAADQAAIKKCLEIYDMYN